MKTLILSLLYEELWSRDRGPWWKAFNKLDLCHQAHCLGLSTVHAQRASGEITFRCFLLDTSWALACAWICLGKSSNRYLLPCTSFEPSAQRGHIFLIHHKNNVQVSQSSGYCSLGVRPAGFSKISAKRGMQTSPESDALGGLVSRK